MYAANTPKQGAIDMRFLVVGLGSIGERHIRNLKSLGFDDFLVYREKNRPPRTLDRSDFKTFHSLSAAIDQAPDVMLVTNPTHLHVPIAIEGARMGIPLFVDIPLSHSLEGTEELVKRAENSGLITLMGFNLRFHPCLIRIRELVQSGAVGPIISVQSESASYLPDWHPWEDYRDGYSSRGGMGGGALLAAGVHELDYLYWIFGPMRSIYGRLGNRSKLQMDACEDSASVVIDFESGAIGEFHCDLIQRPSSRWCKVVGDEGTIYWSLGENRVQIYDPRTGYWETILDVTGFDHNETYIEEMRHLLRCLHGDEKSINDIGQGRTVLTAALSAKESSALGCPVNLQ